VKNLTPSQQPDQRRGQSTHLESRISPETKEVDATETSEGEEALFCEGTCNKWLHRWCAGVHKDDYAVLATSSRPFFCPSCCLSEHRRLITTLIVMVVSLKDEIRELKKEREAMNKPSTLMPVCSDACKEVHTSDSLRESVAQESVPAEDNSHTAPVSHIKTHTQHNISHTFSPPTLRSSSSFRRSKILTGSASPTKFSPGPTVAASTGHPSSFISA